MLEHFYDSAFKILSGNYSICIILVLALLIALSHSSWDFPDLTMMSNCRMCQDKLSVSLWGPSFHFRAVKQALNQAGVRMCSGTPLWAAVQRPVGSQRCPAQLHAPWRPAFDVECSLQSFDVLVLACHVWAVWGSAQDSMHRFNVPCLQLFPSVILNPPRPMGRERVLPPCLLSECESATVSAVVLPGDGRQKW